jgi:excisionase family DNA binding protein
MQPDELLTTAEVASMLKVSAASVQKWCKSGELEAFHLGHWRIPLPAVEKFLEARLNTARQRIASKAYKIIPATERSVDR